MFRFIAIILAILGAVLLAPPARAAVLPESSTCLACHAEKDSGAPVVDSAAFAASRHGKSSCSGCHADILEFPHPEKRRKVDCGACHAGQAKALAGSVHAGKGNACAACHGRHDIKNPRRLVLSLCARCHAVEAKKFAASIHGQASARGVRAAPTCTDCHGEHDIRAPRGSRAKVCADCHQSARMSNRLGLPADRVKTFQSSFHGMAGSAGDLSVADCASCHGWHEVQPSSNPASRTHPDKLAQTCGQCHPGAGKRWGQGMKVHETLSQEGGGSALAAFVASLYGIFIPLTVLGMLFHNGLDLSRKMRGPRALRHRLDEVPLSLSERWQHAANGLSFLMLAYSGFALHNPHAWWSAPFRAMGGEALRRNAHRLAAALFLLVGAAHLAYLASRPGRLRLWAMLPAWRDLKDPLRLLAYNSGVSGKKPELRQFSYIEKFEYWALVWGSLVMTATGGLLLFHNLALAWLPLWITETARVVHYLEAVLACLAILIWHGYWAILDPDVYPMNWAWLTGETYRHENAKEPPDDAS